MKMLFPYLCFFSLIACEDKPTKIDNDFQSLIYADTIKKADFLEKMEFLSTDTVNSDKIFKLASDCFFGKEYENFNDPINMRGFLPKNFEYYDFDSVPKKVHRYRTVQNILKSQLEKGKVSGNCLISELEDKKLTYLIGMTFAYRRKYSPTILDYIEQDVLKNANNTNERINENYRRQAARVLMHSNPEKYIVKTMEYFLKNHESELSSVMNYVFREQDFWYLSLNLKKALVQNLLNQYQNKNPYFAYYDLKIIEKLTKIELTKPYENPRNEEEATIIYEEMKEKVVEEVNNWLTKS